MKALALALIIEASTLHSYQLDGRWIMMDCTRFAQMYHAASTLGIDRFDAWLSRNHRRFDKGELLIYKHEIKMLVKRRRGVPITFPQAMLACGEEWS